MSQSCSIKKCGRMSRALCDCCKQNLCLQHLNEHTALLMSQLNPLAQEINTVGHHLKTLNIQKTIEDGRRKLDQWRKDAYKKIDYFYEQKCQELEQFISETLCEQQETCNRLYAKITHLLNAQDANRQDIESLTLAVRQLKQNISNIENTSLTMNVRPLLLDDKFFYINRAGHHDFDLSNFSLAGQTIHFTRGSSMSITCNDQYLLIHQKPNICLCDQQMNIIKQTLWPHGEIRDMCWSSVLNRFIVLEEDNIFVMNQNSMSIDKAHTIQERRWISCTCSDTSLFACTNESGSSIIEISLTPTIESIQKWKSPLTCTKDEYIDGIVYNNGNLALMISNAKKKSIRIELKTIDTLKCIWSLPLDIMCSQDKSFRCCSLPLHEWLVVDYENGRLLQITKDGKIKKTKQYQPSPYRAILFDLDKLVVSTMNSVYLHTF